MRGGANASPLLSKTEKMNPSPPGFPARGGNINQSCPEAKAGEVTPLQALTTALAATVGTGNIAGITTAVTLGGAGAIFWLWVSALLGMATKYSEVLLSVKYRERNVLGDWVGGPMYYIKNGLGKNWKWLGAVFCVLGGLASFGIGNAVQVGNITDSINTAIQSFVPAAADHQMVINIVVAVILMAVIGVVLVGGIKRIGEVTEFLVPIMSIIYIAACLVVIALNVTKVPTVFGMIFQGAFTPAAVTGGAAGVGIKAVVKGTGVQGQQQGQTGQGADNDGVHEHLEDTVEALLDGVRLGGGRMGDRSGTEAGLVGEYAALNAPGDAGLDTHAGGAASDGRRSECALEDHAALSTVLSWGLYGTRCWEYLLGEKAVKPYQIIFTLVVIISATMDLSLAWAIADTLNGLMAIPNLIGLILLCPVVFKLTREYFDNEKRLRK